MTSESCKTAGTAHSHREGSRDKSCWNTSSMPTRCRHSSHRLRSEGEKRCRDSHHAGSGVAEVSARFILQVTDNNAKVKRGGGKGAAHQPKSVRSAEEMSLSPLVYLRRVVQPLTALFGGSPGYHDVDERREQRPYTSAEIAPLKGQSHFR